MSNIDKEKIKKFLRDLAGWLGGSCAVFLLFVILLALFVEFSLSSNVPPEKQIALSSVAGAPKPASADLAALDRWSPPKTPTAGPSAKSEDPAPVQADSKIINNQLSIINSPDWLDELIEKIWLVESSGRLNPPDGDGGKAGGPLQIHPGVIKDVNQYYGTEFTLDDRFDLEKSKLIAKLYITMWMEIQREQIAARIYKGGPAGFERESTLEDWCKIEEVN